MLLSAYNFIKVCFLSFVPFYSLLIKATSRNLSWHTGLRCVKKFSWLAVDTVIVSIIYKAIGNGAFITIFNNQ